MSHAVIRIICFLVIATFLTLGNTLILALAAILTLFLYLFDPPENSKLLFKSISRMKWFFLSILLVYLLLDPVGSNPVSQFLFGVKRIAILVLIFLMVMWIIRVTQREQLVSALIFLLRPLAWLGLPINQFALRIELIFTNMEKIRKTVSCVVSGIDIKKNRLSETAREISSLFKHIISAADQAPLLSVSINKLDGPSLRQWMLPVVIFCLCYFLQYYP